MYIYDNYLNLDSGAQVEVCRDIVNRMQTSAEEIIAIGQMMEHAFPMCKGCSTRKPRTDFYAGPKKTGVQSQCIECMAMNRQMRTLEKGVTSLKM
jgi:hypothetical protein